MIDRETTAARRFEDDRSKILKDKRQVLVGLDWAEQKIVLFCRSKGLCERWTVLHKAHDAWCSGKAEEAHHIIRRSNGRDDRLANLAGLSHACHAAEDLRKVRSDKRERREAILGEGKR